ncbi:hypothetical protein, partial [Amycolatopsis taiwanensis]|uniref:hypothetical protein n=1 Tax=Amycolatopsis taiwanensis TaxID=342230 RepID=UPI0025537512
RRRTVHRLAMTLYEYKSEFVRKYIHQGRAEGEAKGRAEGEAKGEAKAVLAVLESRGIEVPEQVRERISGCTDLDQLEGWIHRVATVNSVDELFNQAARGCQPQQGRADAAST